MGIFFRTKGRRLGLQGFEFRVVGVVAAGAKIIGPFARTGKVSYPFSMDAGLPVFELRTMTLTTEPIAFSEID